MRNDEATNVHISHHNISAICAQRCARLDCTQTSFKAHLIHARPALHTRTFLQTLNMVEYSITHLPQMQFVQFAIYAGSYCGIWLGLDLLVMQFVIKLGGRMATSAWRRYRHTHETHTITMVEAF